MGGNHAPPLPQSNMASAPRPQHFYTEQGIHSLKSTVEDIANVKMLCEDLAIRSVRDDTTLQPEGADNENEDDDGRTTRHGSKLQNVEAPESLVIKDRTIRTSDEPESLVVRERIIAVPSAAEDSAGVDGQQRQPNEFEGSSAEAPLKHASEECVNDEEQRGHLSSRGQSSLGSHSKGSQETVSECISPVSGSRKLVTATSATRRDHLASGHPASGHSSAAENSGTSHPASGTARSIIESNVAGKKNVAAHSAHSAQSAHSTRPSSPDEARARAAAAAEARVKAASSTTIRDGSSSSSATGVVNEAAAAARTTSGHSKLSTTSNDPSSGQSKVSTSRSSAVSKGSSSHGTALGSGVSGVSKGSSGRGSSVRGSGSPDDSGSREGRREKHKSVKGSDAALQKQQVLFEKHERKIREHALKKEHKLEEKAERYLRQAKQAHALAIAHGTPAEAHSSHGAPILLRSRPRAPSARARNPGRT